MTPNVQHRSRLNAVLCTLDYELRAFPSLEPAARVASLREALRQTIRGDSLSLLAEAVSDTASVRASTDTGRAVLAIDRPRIASSAA